MDQRNSEHYEINVKNFELITILYDNDCRFCNWCRRFVEKRDKGNRCCFVGIRESEADSLFENEEIKISRSNPESIAVILDSNVTYRWRASMEILKLLTWPWRVLGFLGGLLPIFLGDYIYDATSRNRNLLCKIVRC